MTISFIGDNGAESALKEINFPPTWPNDDKIKLVVIGRLPNFDAKDLRHYSFEENAGTEAFCKGFPENMSCLRITGRSIASKCDNEMPIFSMEAEGQLAVNKHNVLIFSEGKATINFLENCHRGGCLNFDIDPQLESYNPNHTIEFSNMPNASMKINIGTHQKIRPITDHDYSEPTLNEEVHAQKPDFCNSVVHLKFPERNGDIEFRWPWDHEITVQFGNDDPYKLEPETVVDGYKWYKLRNNVEGYA
jgi:hypothetical protein